MPQRNADKIGRRCWSVEIYEINFLRSAKEKLEIVQSERVASTGGRKGGVGGIPPAEPSQFRSDIFKQTPPVMNTTPKDWISPKIQIRETKDRGKGMFAVEKIISGEPLVIFGGEYTDAEGAKKARFNGKLVMQWDDNLFSVEDRGDDSGYFINHSCDPNTWMKDSFTIIAMRDIKVGEEVTADYVLWQADENYISKWECKCGSPLCRKRVTGKDWRFSELQERYNNHFSPLINKKINNFKAKM